MIGFDEAWELVVDLARPLASEVVPLAQAHRRILARPVVAAIDSPRTDVSAMDGYALRDTDLPLVRVIGKAFPGAAFTGAIKPGDCVRIFTGAAIPEGADRVVVQESVHRDGDKAWVEGAVSPARHIRLRGSDFKIGDQLLATGRRLDARGLLAAAGADLADVGVWRRPRVAVLATGDELSDPGSARDHSDRIPESVSLGVAALVVEWGGEVVRRERVCDDPNEMKRAAEQSLAQSDMVVLTGGASVGEKDYAKSVFAALGLELLFSKVAIKPGKPVWLGRINAKLVMGLPGNPTSALVTARLFLAPLVTGLGGGEPADAARWRKAPLARRLGPCDDRETFIRGYWDGAAVLPLSNQDSSAQRALAEANALIRRRSGSSANEERELVEMIDF